MTDELTALAEEVGVMESPDRWWWARDLPTVLTLMAGAYVMLVGAGLAEMPL